MAPSIAAAERAVAERRRTRTAAVAASHLCRAVFLVPVHRQLLRMLRTAVVDATRAAMSPSLLRVFTAYQAPTWVSSQRRAASPVLASHDDLRCAAKPHDDLRCAAEPEQING
ncbi:hypothetical protein ACP4OV_020924 [Aristida adscensionis]